MSRAPHRALIFLPIWYQNPPRNAENTKPARIAHHHIRNERTIRRRTARCSHRPPSLPLQNICRSCSRCHLLLRSHWRSLPHLLVLASRMVASVSRARSATGPRRRHTRGRRTGPCSLSSLHVLSVRALRTQSKGACARHLSPPHLNDERMLSRRPNCSFLFGLTEASSIIFCRRSPSLATNPALSTLFVMTLT